MIYGVLLGAGMGTRLNGGTLPKQFLNIGGTSVLRLTLEKFLLCPDIDRIVAAVPEGWVDHAADLLRNVGSNVDICPGGKDRQESLYCALKFIERTYGLHENDIAVSHDAARPFVTLRIIEENIALCREHGATDTVVPASDTLVLSEDGCLISAMPPRRHAYQGQTPQSFHIARFLSLYESLSPEYLASLTDVARLFMENGETVTLVKGEIFNIKITTEHDLRFAEYMIERGTERHA